MKFSIIIPTKNRARLLFDTLESLLKVDYPLRSFEVIIVNNGSTDNTKKVINSFIKQHPEGQITVCYEKMPGRSRAFNKGLSKAKFSKVISIDDDIKVPISFLNDYRQAFLLYPDAAAIGGKIIVKTSSLLTKFMKRKLFYFPWVFGIVDYGNKAKLLNYGEAVFAGNMAFNLEYSPGKKVFNSILGRKYKDGYLYGEDFELCLRFILDSKKIAYFPKIIVENIIDNERFSFSYLMRRHFYAGIERAITYTLLSGYKNYELPFENIRVDQFNFYNFKNEILFQRILYTLAFMAGYSLVSLEKYKKKLRLRFNF